MSGKERSKGWSVYTSSDRFGTSMNAISFGFIATAILISMFLIMAVFEHLFRPNHSFTLPRQLTPEKLENQHSGWRRRRYGSEFSVVMPGEQYPSYIAQPAPLPCQREPMFWPSHHPFHY